MKPVVNACLCAVVLVALTAQTPAPDQAVAVPLKTPRHLEYKFNASYFQSGEQHTDAFSAGGEGSEGSGVVSSFGSAGGSGTIAADVVAFTNTGGLVVKITEAIDREPRPEQTFTCIVYGDGRMNCPNLAGTQVAGVVQGPTDVETLLLGFLGRGFLDASKMDAKNHWQITYDNGSGSVTADFTMTDPGGGKPVAVVEHKKFSPRNNNVASAVQDVNVTYDAALSVPVRIDQEKHESWGGGTLKTTIGLQLTKDSFAPASP